MALGPSIRYVNAQLMPLYVHESGVPGSPAVVFLHGAGVSGRMWRDHMAKLDSYHCLAPDLPGFGRSTNIPWRSRIETTKLIAELIETRIPAGRAHVVGLSVGGSIVHALLDRRPDLLDRVIIDGAGALPWWGNGPYLVGIAMMSPFLHTRPVVEMLSRSVGGFPPTEKEDIRLASRSAFLRSYVDALATRITPAEVGAACPTLLVAGEREVAVRRSNRALARRMPEATAGFVPGTGHGWIGLRRELHLATVEAWLGGAAPPEGVAVEINGHSATTE